MSIFDDDLVQKEEPLYVFYDMLKSIMINTFIKPIDVYSKWDIYDLMYRTLDLNITKIRKLGYWRYDLYVDNVYDEFIVKLFGYDIKCNNRYEILSFAIVADDNNRIDFCLLSMYE